MLLAESNGISQGYIYDLQLLQALVVENPELERLESLLDQFNVFEAIGAVRQELRHSDFLAFLLNPRQSHRIGDVFVKRLLQKALSLSEQTLQITPIDLDIWDLDDVEIRREWMNIDILILDELHKLAVVIENKVFTVEHSNQLQQYKLIITQQFPDYRVVGLFLTPEGEPPSDTSYIPISYDLVCRSIEELSASHASTIGQDILTMMRHYTQMLRRHIVNESEIADLCQKIYHKHQRALDLIYEYRPDLQASLSEFLVEMIRQTPGMIIDHSSKSYLHFLPGEWDIPFLQGGQGWTRSGRILLFEIYNGANVLKLNLSIGPGPTENRQSLMDMAAAYEPPFKRAFRALGKMWNNIFSRTLLTASAYEEKGLDELEDEIRKKWNHFVAHELYAMNEIISAEPWFSKKS
jgi:hypothetical protein